MLISCRRWKLKLHTYYDNMSDYILHHTWYIIFMLWWYHIICERVLPLSTFALYFQRRMITAVLRMTIYIHQNLRNVLLSLTFSNFRTYQGTYIIMSEKKYVKEELGPSRAREVTWTRVKNVKNECASKLCTIFVHTRFWNVSKTIFPWVFDLS